MAVVLAIQVILRTTWAVWQIKIMEGVLLTVKENIGVVEHMLVMHSLPCTIDITDNIANKGHKSSVTSAVYFSPAQVLAYVAIFREASLNLMQRYLRLYIGKR
jgi:hypothetical protein